jgi:hypothetical protein
MVPARCRATNPSASASSEGRRRERVIGTLGASARTNARRYRRGSVVRSRASSSGDAADIPGDDASPSPSPPSSSSSSSSSREGETDAQKRSAPRLVPFAVRVATPPPKDLGTHKLPKNTACGETIEVDESWFIVDRVTTMYNLVRGKYRKDGSRLDVQRAERFFVNASLEAAFAADSAAGHDDEKNR